MKRGGFCRMLRKSSVIFMLIVVIGVLSACSSGDDNEDSTGEQAEDQTEDTEAEENTDENDASAQSEGTDEDKEQDEAAEEKEPEYYISEETSSIEPIDDAEEKVVLLTIDDAPDENALEMAETLKEKDAKVYSLLMVILLMTKKEQRSSKKIYEMGFPIGNHTNTHVVLPDVSEEEQTEEIIAVNDRVEEIIGERPAFFQSASWDEYRSFS